MKTTGIVAIRLGGMTSIYNGFISICFSLQCCWRTFLLLCTKPAFVTSSFLLLTLFFTDCEQGSYASHTFNVFIPILRHPLVLAFGPSVSLFFPFTRTHFFPFESTAHTGRYLSSCALARVKTVPPFLCDRVL